MRSPTGRVVPYKTIPIPGRGKVDISGFNEIIDHPLFQRTDGRAQLGLVGMTYRGAKHSRFEHGVGAMDLTRTATTYHVNKGFISLIDAWNVIIFGLTHDIGQPPRSHAVEYPLGRWQNPSNPITHRDKGIELVSTDARDRHGRTLADCIELCGGEPDRIITLMRKVDPLHQIVTDKTLGTDKLDYTMRDPMMAGFNRQQTDVSNLLPYLIYRNGVYGCEEKQQDELIHFQNFYLELWTELYLGKPSMGMERCLQKAVEYVLRTGELDVHEAWLFDDADLIVTLRRSRDARARRLQERIQTHQAYKAAVVYKPEGSEAKEKVRGKSMTVRSIADSEMHAFLDAYQNPFLLTEVERRIAETLRLEEEDIIITMIPEPEKIVPKDVPLFDSEGRLLPDTLFDRFPLHRDRVVEEARAFFSVRVMVYEQNGASRQGMMKEYEKIDGIVKSSIAERTA